MSEKADKPLGITELVLRDAHQSLFATRLRLEDMLPIAAKLDAVGYWSVESWGGATFDACIRFLGEDPWERIRRLKAAMPRTPQQMLLRGQNLLGYRHYADDVVTAFVERAAENGVDIFRIFDALNDPRNLETAIRAAKRAGKHAQGTMSYTTSPVHTLQTWVDYGRQLQEMGADSICIKDMSGLLRPFEAYELVRRLKQELSIELQLHCHATTGLATATCLKAIEAGVDRVDCAISSMSKGTGHAATESVVAMLDGTPRATGLDLKLLEEVAAYFREVRKKYQQFEGSLRGVDSRILVAQVPGGMLSNLESQLRQQGATDRLDEVLQEIPAVRRDLGYPPLVTPTSQIVGTQAVVNVLAGERYKSLTKETQGILKGEYGATPAPVAAELLQRALADGGRAISCRPADQLPPELERLTAELTGKAAQEQFRLATPVVDDVLIYALFPQAGLKFLAQRDNPAAFEPPPAVAEAAAGKPAPAARSAAASAQAEVYTVTVNGVAHVVQVSEGGAVQPVAPPSPSSPPLSATVGGEPVTAPLAGTILKVLAAAGQNVQEGDVLLVLEAMKMETDICAPRAGRVTGCCVKSGDAVTVGETLLTLG